MAPNRRTKAERRQEWADAERSVWEEFKPKLTNLKSYEDAKILVNQAPPPDTPGRKYYSNLGFLLQHFAVPANSSYEEQSLYLQLIRRLDSTGQLKPGVGQKVEEELKRAMEAQGSW